MGGGKTIWLSLRKRQAGKSVSSQCHASSCIRVMYNHFEASLSDSHIPQYLLRRAAWQSNILAEVLAGDNF